MTVLVKSTIKSEAVAVNDEFYKIKGDGRDLTFEVGSVKVGTKWVTLRTAEGKLIAELPIGTDVEVGRWELTEEEVAERNAEREAEQRAWRAGDMLKTLRRHADAKVELSGADVLDYSKLTSALQTQAKANLANEILRAIEYRQSKGETDVVAIVEGWVEHSMTSVVFRASNPLSRSSSVVSNLIEDVQRGVFCELADNVRRGYLI